MSRHLDFQLYDKLLELDQRTVTVILEPAQLWGDECSSPYQYFADESWLNLLLILVLIIERQLLWSEDTAI